MTHTEPAARLQAEGLRAAAWGNGPGDRYAAHEHDYDKVIVAVAGSIVFGLPERGADVTMAAGDRLELPAGTRHDALVGPAGVGCLEARLAAGSLSAVAYRPAGTW